jgi:ABC-type multidrug transport system fused ATPase/permease subunit
VREQLKRIAALLDLGTRLRLVLLVVGFLIAALLEAMTLGLLFLLFKIIVEPEAVAGSRVLGFFRDLAGGEMRRFLVGFCIVLLLLFVAKSAILLLAAWLRPHVEWRIRSRLSSLILESYLCGPYLATARRNGSELTNNIVTGVGYVAYGAIGIADLVGETLLVVIINATLLYLQPLLTVSALVAFTLASVLYGRSAQRRSRSWGQRSTEASARVLAATTEPIIGLKSIKTAAIEPFFLAKFQLAYELLGRVSRHSAFLAQALRPVLELAVAVALIGAILFLLLHDQPVAQIVPVIALFGAAAYRLMPSIIRANLALQSLQFARTPIATVHDDITRFLARRPATTAPGGPPGMLRHEIRLEHVSFRYEAGGEATLHDVSLAIRRGESVGIVGSSGAGKTTLVDIILGLIEPSAGTVLIDGASRELGRHGLFSYVPQDSFLINDSIRHNIALGDDARRIDAARLAAAVEAASLDPFVASLPKGIDTVVGERGIRLSGGQRQRIAIARAIYRNADILVLDESTSALDSVTEGAVAEAIQRLRRTRTLVIIAHRLSTVKNCDRLFLLEAGRLVEEGSFAELVQRNGTFRAMVREMELSHHQEGAVAAVRAALNAYPP